MPLMSKTPFSTFNRGAQTSIHEFKMMAQSFANVLFISMVVVLVFGIATAYLKTTKEERYTGYKWVEASVIVNLFGPNRTINYVDDTGTEQVIPVVRYLRSDLAKDSTTKILTHFKVGLIYGTGLSAIIITAVLGFFHFIGASQSQDFHLRGASIATPAQTAALLRKKGAPGSIEVGGIPIPKKLEPSHFLLVGAPSTGKTVQISAMLDGIRKHRQRAVIYDVSGVFLSKYYRPGKDIILNPLDERTHNWSPWADVHEDSHCDQIVESLIEAGGSDPFWSMAARSVLRSAMKQLAEMTHAPKIQDLLRLLMQSPTDDLAHFLADTDAASILSMESPKTAASIRAHLTTYLRSWSPLSDTGPSFSIRDWINEETNDAWLFITTRADQLATLKPLMTVWVDIATSALMSLQPSPTRRIWMMFDELPTLQQLPSLQPTLAVARKYGGCVTMGIQSMTQLISIYGREKAHSISGGASTHLIFRANDIDTCRWASDSIGEQEIAEASEGLSFGANTLRDGRTTNVSRATKHLVMAAQIRNLPDLHLYLNCGRGVPVTSLVLKPKNRPDVADPYIPRTIPGVVMDTIPSAPIKPTDGQGNQVPPDPRDMAHIPPQGRPSETEPPPSVAPRGAARPKDAPTQLAMDIDSFRQPDPQSAGDVNPTSRDPDKGRTASQAPPAPSPTAAGGTDRKSPFAPKGEDIDAHIPDFNTLTLGAVRSSRPGSRP